MVALLTVAALLAAPPASDQVPGCSVGRAWGGGLRCATAMPLNGEHYKFSWVARKKGSNFGTPLMVNLLQRAAGTVGVAVGGPPLILGSISVRHGGKMNPHKSHQAGRDVDILFYVRGPDGTRHRAVGFYEFDGAGRCMHPRCKGWTFDVQRNWWLVRTLLWSKRPEVQYIFVSNPLKQLMLEYARRRQEHPEILKRAQRVLAEPGNSSPHADHFHVRIYCSPADKAAGCVDGGPRWPWVGK